MTEILNKDTNNIDSSNLISDLNENKPIEQPELAKHDISILDLVFLMDCTGSMRKYIESATDVNILF